MPDKLLWCVITDPRSATACDLAMRRPHARGLGASVYATDFDPAEINEVTSRNGDLIEVRSPVFFTGELIAIDGGTGREICGRMRKPSKWGIAFEVHPDVEDAARRAVEVTEWFIRNANLADADREPLPPPTHAPLHEQAIFRPHGEEAGGVAALAESLRDIDGETA